MQRIYTERAHLMCPDMYFGIVIAIDSVFDNDRMIKAADALSKAHPFLQSVLGHDKDGYYYNNTNVNKIQVIVKDEAVSGIDDPIILREYNSLTKNEWDLRTDGMLKILTLKNGDRTIFLFVFHHLLTDGRGALGLAEEFANCYKNGVVPNYVEEKLISSKNDMPENSTLPFVSKLLVKRANKQWKRENHTLSYDKYLELAGKYLKSDKIDRNVKLETAENYKDMVKACHEHRVSVNDYLMAQMYINDKTDKIIIAYDLRPKLSCYRQGAMGNYSTAFSVVHKNKTSDIWKVAQDVHDLVRKITDDPRSLYLVLQCYADLEGELLDASFAAARCGYESKAAGFIGTMFFGFSESKGYSITNLGKFDSRNIEEAAFIPPASPAIKKTLGVLSVNGKMYIGSAVRE
ncbi:hypothetical protein [Ruminococcus sp.]|uniref:hypothetical protein n=1 Tax=Ruminococcus sp. TaxID=41978 RepID=UPI0025D01DC5|nr:hypothetical protein [Ruminococcus sp.]